MKIGRAEALRHSMLSIIDSGKPYEALTFVVCWGMIAMLGVPLRRAAAPIVLTIIAFAVGIGSPTARAQGADNLDALKRKAQELHQAGRHVEALVLQRRLVVEIEQAEIADAGGPGAKTVDALVNVAWYALLARDFKQALAASDRAHSIVPADLRVEANRAHSLLFIGRLDEARAIYLANKGRPMSLTDDRMWQDVIADDVSSLRKAGLKNPVLAKINAKLGGKSAAIDTDLVELNQRIQELSRVGKYTEGVLLAEKYVALARRRYGESSTEFATAISWLAFLHKTTARYAEAEPLYRRALAIREKTFGPDHSEVANTLSNIAGLYLAQGRYGEAEPLYRRALAIDEKALGADHSDVGSDLNNLAALYQDQGRYAEAEPLYKRALAIGEKTLGRNNTDVGRRLNNLAVLYQYQGRFAEAEPLMRRAVAIDENALGPDHPSVGIDLNNLAGLYQDQGRYREAEPLYRRALAIEEKALGADHPNVGADLNNLASLYRVQGRYAEAELLYKRALAIQEKAFGPNHPSVGIDLNNLAELYRTQGRYAEAEPLYKRTLAIGEKALGADHPNVGADLNNLALLYQDQGRYDEAEPLMKRALAIQEKAFGPDHPSVGIDLSSLATLYQDQGRYDEAEPLMKRALAIREKALGSNHPDVGKALTGLALLYRAQGRYGEAEPLFKRALGIDESAFGSDHPDVGKDLNNLALLYEAQGRDPEAEALMKRAIVIAETTLGPDHPSVSIRLSSLASLYEGQNRYAEAEPLAKRALAIAEKSLGPNHPDTGNRLNILAALYTKDRRYAEAEPLYKRALAIAETTFGPDHTTVGAALNNLSEVYYQQGHFGEAEALLKRALAIQENALGPDHPIVGKYLNNLAILNFTQKNWASAAEYWRRSTSVTIRRAQRGTLVVGQPLTGKQKSEATQQSPTFRNFVKAVSRQGSEQSNDASSLRETFQSAQWAQSSEAAESLAQMAARGAKGDPILAALARQRQDLLAEWQKRDAIRSAIVALAPDARKQQADSETENAARLAEIDRQISDIDAELEAQFPDYAALASPAPLSVEDVQKELGGDEALVLFLDTPLWYPTPEETFIWIVTKTEVRWVRSELGTSALTQEVAALRCGLDYDGSWTGSHCSELLKTSYSWLDYAAGKPLPFDLARANKLYKALFGQIEDVIKDKRLLIVPSGPLTQLPFQVLVQSLPSDVSAVERPREIARLGAELGNLSDDDRKRLLLKDAKGVRIVRTLKDSAAEAAGLKPDDIVLSLDGIEFDSNQKLTLAVQAHAPGDKVQIHILRDGAELTVSTTLGAITIREWIPRFLGRGEGKNVAWLTRDHAIAVLPAVSSLRALRALAKESHASEAFIGFGDPLLDGEPTKFSYDAIAAKLARDAHCPASATPQVAALSNRGATRAGVRSNGGLADLADLRSWAPLPETADELCDVAQNLGVDPATHLYLGAKATETEIKRLSADGMLAKYKIIHLATHGAIAGELSGTSEPGLILTPPEKASEIDDGYLSASEIAALNLDADWVILSACNTAAGDTKGAEALSGLARAFFYAGARSLLVSHWEVASQSTVKLITKAIAELKADPKIGRAEALRRSMLSLIATGKDYEAHPAFWAPFVLVGEGRAAQ
jgi:tetratricopeptide (TPR) repeat protein/CHAT domain-containing protein